VDCDNYLGTLGTKYEEPTKIGWNCIEVLEFLKGKPYDKVALAFIHALRPSCIRVTTGTIKLNAHTWRVTVYIDDNNIIKEIEQEVEVALPDHVDSGEALAVALKYGIDSEQCKWYDDDTIESYFMDGINGIYYKCTKNGMVPFPKSE